MYNISDPMTADAAKAYFTSPHDYYIDGHNPPGVFGGKLMEEFGLKGQPVEKEPFERLCDGVHPVTGEDLVLNRLPNRRAANDITMSATKYFSLIYLGEKDPERRRQLLKAFDDSCDWIMGVAEQDAATRVRVGGADHDRRTGNWGYAGFTQFESRPDDKTGLPVIQIHRHHTVFNLTRDQVEDRIKALQLGLVKGKGNLLAALWYNDFARRVRELGYGISIDPKGGEVGFGIEGIPRELVDRFSPRRQTIMQAKARIAKAEGITDPKRLRRLQAELGKLTRRGKQKDLDMAALWRVWERQLTPQDRKALEAAKGRKGWVTTDRDALEYAIEHLQHRKSVFTETQMLIEALRFGVGSVTLEGLKAQYGPLGVMVDPDGRVSTKLQWRQEGFMIDFARQGLGSCRPVMTKSRAADWLAEDLKRARAKDRKAIELSDEQRVAVVALLSSCNRVNIVDAGQGTGKTTMMHQFGKALKEQKTKTTWLGTTNKAVEKLAEQGADAMTVAAFLRSDKAKTLAAGSRIIVDEVSMLGHADAYRLLAFAQENGCRVDFVGDSKQYKSPAAGSPMQLLIKYSGIKPITMTKTMRQKGKLRQAMDAIRDDRELAGHDILTELGMVHELPADQLAAKASELYLKWTETGNFVPVIAPTHALGDEIAAGIRKGLRKRGDLTGEDHAMKRLMPLHWSPAQVRESKKRGLPEGVAIVGGNAYREMQQHLAVGDLVRTMVQGRTKDGKHRFKAGASYTIKGFTEECDPVLNNGWVVDKDSGYLVQRYVTTGQVQQGETAWNGIAVYGKESLVATRHEGYYVPLSRVRKEVAVITDDAAALREAIQKRDDRTSATDVFGEADKIIPYDIFTRYRRQFYDQLREQAIHVNPREKVNQFGHSR